MRVTLSVLLALVVAPTMLAGAAAAAEAPYCSKREHLGEPGYLVDQAWVNYRHLEKSSPARIGWCQCAKRCEPIDFMAADIERSAFDARAASVDPSVPPRRREQYAELSIELFGERNETVESFRDCYNAMRPPLSPRLSRAAAPIEGCVKKALSLKERWKLWCKEFRDKWDVVYADFFTAYGDKPANEYKIDFYILATPNGKLRWSGEGVWSREIPDRVARNYIKRITDIQMPPFPAGSRLSYHQWQSTFIIRNNTPENGTFLNEKMDCPKEDDPPE